MLNWVIIGDWITETVSAGRTPSEKMRRMNVCTALLNHRPLTKMWTSSDMTSHRCEISRCPNMKLLDWEIHVSVVEQIWMNVRLNNVGCVCVCAQPARCKMAAARQVGSTPRKNPTFWHFATRWFLNVDSGSPKKNTFLTQKVQKSVFYFLR